MKMVLRLAAAAGLLALSTSAFALSITPADCGTTFACWTGNETANKDADDIEAVVMTGTELFEDYKQDVGGPESGGFADDYDTVFANSAMDPAEATISWIGPDAIGGDEIYLYVKDGNQEPAWYLFDISAWDGMETLELTGFWPDNGAISHVSLFSSRGDDCCNEVPEPGTIALFGLGIFGLGLMRRRRTI